ncbi:diaminopimelate decarboxylase [Syntrophotalea acetylenivorans]|uniref:Diaminopimelate decarboxylase n=1 Tax=Syntrophotalea acetylenivorans TaxID=1842532 RepID=A0A1L3GSF7_9BACT|nr:diaminopimelate decarboxylase [Syntrophotalea acetylenivorans]APG28800.1 diaminopimelate decarboxylase [Syntrophotalea acetylenivorans]
MNHFEYQGNDLYCEDVAVKDIAAQVGTPFYLYSHATLSRHMQAFTSAFASVPHIVCYSIKANSNLAVLKTFVTLGSGFDMVSGGELFRAQQVGCDPQKIVYSGVGKTEPEIEAALNANILMFNVESPQELETIDRVAGRLGKKAGIAIRVNPDVDPQTHPYISTGMKQAKFGINISQALEDYRRAAAMPNLEVIGVDCHIGSQLTKLSPFVDAIKKIRELVETLKQEGFAIKYLDLGGGLGITYEDEEPPTPTDYAEAIIEATKGLDVTLIFEPGRMMVGNAGILAAKVLYVKEGEAKNFVIVDAAMNDLARPALYGSYQGIEPVDRSTKERMVADVVGPICESGDFLAQDREIPAFKQGDLIAVSSAGAYGFTMASNYNSRPRTPEVMVKGDQVLVIRQRETYDDLIKGESIPEGI